MRTRDAVDVEIGLSYFRMSSDEIEAVLEALSEAHHPAYRLMALRNFVKETAPRFLFQLAARLRFFGFLDEAADLVERSNALEYCRDPYGPATLNELRDGFAQMVECRDIVVRVGALRNWEFWSTALGIDLGRHIGLMRAAYRSLCLLHGVEPEEFDALVLALESVEVEAGAF